MVRPSRSETKHEARYTDNQGVNAVVWCRNEYQVALIQLLDRIADNLERAITLLYQERRHG